MEGLTPLVVLGFCTLLSIVAPIMIGLMIKYLKNKPILQQTPYDQICIDLGRIEIFTVLGYSSMCGLPLCLGPFSDQVADILSKLWYLTICLHMVAVLGTLLTRYMTVFHGVDDIDDLKVVSQSLQFDCRCAVLVFIFDLGFGQTGGFPFQIMTDTLDR
jgi:hypothetical protein